MHVEIYMSLLVAIVGAFFYLMAKNGKAELLSLVSFGAGLLAFLLRATGLHFGIG